MKKIILVLVLVLSVMGCSVKKETAADIMKKVAENTKKTDFAAIELTGNVAGIYQGQGITVDFPLLVNVEIDHVYDPDLLTMSLESHSKILGEEMSFQVYYTDKIMYIDVNGLRSHVEVDLGMLCDALKSFDASVVDYSVYNNFFVVGEDGDEKTLTGELSGEQMNELFAEFSDDALNEYLQLINFNSMSFTLYITSDYQLDRMTCDADVQYAIMDQAVDMNLDYEMKLKSVDSAQISLPELNGWSKRKTACTIESEPVSTVIFVESEGENIEYIGLSYFFSYEGYGLSTQAQKAYLKQLVEETYSPYQEFGINMVIQNEDEDHLILSMSVDYQNASGKALDILGIAGGLTYSQLFGDTEGMDCTNY